MVKSSLLLLISIIPLNFIKIWFYRILFNYDIDYKSRIGLFNIIKAKHVKLVKATIGRLNYIEAESIFMDESSSINKLNRVKNLNTLKLGERSRVHDKNFISGNPKNINIQGFEFNEQNLILGNDSAINRNNYFDVVRSITIGNNVVFGGIETQVWTHGFDLDRTMLVGAVEFGNDIFIGSRCTFTKGIKVVDGVTIGPASVIYKSIEEKGVYSTHQICKVK